MVTKSEECFCCSEIDRCQEKLEELDEEEWQACMCITEHPGFKTVCLDIWVLETAAVGFKTRQKRSYTELREKGGMTESE